MEFIFSINMENLRINRVLSMKMPVEKITTYENVAGKVLDQLQETCENHVILSSAGFKMPNCLVLGFDMDIINVDKFGENETEIDKKIADILHRKKIPSVIDIALTMFRVEIIDGIARYIFRIADEDTYFEPEQFIELVTFLKDLP